MNFTPGTRVFFWDSRGAVVRGAVQSVGRTADGAQTLTIKVDGSGNLVTLPAAGVTKE